MGVVFEEEASTKYVVCVSRLRVTQLCEAPPTAAEGLAARDWAAKPPIVISYLLTK